MKCPDFRVSTFMRSTKYLHMIYVAQFTNSFLAIGSRCAHDCTCMHKHVTCYVSWSTGLIVWLLSVSLVVFVRMYVCVYTYVCTYVYIRMYLLIHSLSILNSCKKAQLSAPHPSLPLKWLGIPVVMYNAQYACLHYAECKIHWSVCKVGKRVVIS